MYFAKNYHEKYAHYQEISTLKFFHDITKKAIRRYKNGKKLPKNKMPVVFGTTINDFDKNKDNIIARIETNQRGVLRDFIGIDWDFDEGEEDKLENVLESLSRFTEQYETPILIYPTASFPKKPRIRTVMFTKELMDNVEYSKAVTFVEKYIGENHNDESNYNLKHNFNLPAINNKEQMKMLYFVMKDAHKPLDNQLWDSVEPNVKTYNSNNKHVKEVLVTREERMPHTDKDVELGLATLKEHRSEATKGSQFDFNRYYSFFQFLHAVARAEVIGSITNQQAHMILKRVADGNRDWEQRNREDYTHEFPRVEEDETKLKRARLLSYYFGFDW